MLAGMSRPNILLILSDDHGYGDRGPGVNTPNLDRLAAQGTTLHEGYVTAPICSPSRAGLISGRHQARWGAQWFDSAAFPPDGASLPEQLGRTGYTSGYFGKVHYGGGDDPGERPCPPHHGFDETLYILAKFHLGRANYLHRGPEAVAAYGEAAGVMGVGTLWDGDQQVAPEGFLTDIWADRAEEFIGDHATDADPFFCMVAFNAVHNFCWQLPAEELRKRGLPTAADWDPAVQPYTEWYDDVIHPNLEHGREYYLAQLELMDAAIGRLLDRLDTEGIADDTIVVYLTDNGGSTCNYGDNGPLRGTKYTLWEGGVRVPFIVRWPGIAPAGIVRDGLASSLDLVPTLVTAGGGSPESGDGHDLAPLLRGEGDGHDELHWVTGFQWSIRRGQWKLYWCDAADEATRAIAATEHAPFGDGYWLSDLSSDLGESRNLAAECPGVLADLITRHERWRRDVAGQPDWRAAPVG